MTRNDTINPTFCTAPAVKAEAVHPVCWASSRLAIAQRSE
jgi:hypothetical protein